MILVGTVGYSLLGFVRIDALYQTVTTITTVGFREVHPLGQAGKWFTIVLILLGVESEERERTKGARTRPSRKNRSP